MTDQLFHTEEGNTLLTAEEMEGLIPSYITTRGQLNVAEQANIEKAVRWANSRKRNVLDAEFLKRIHKKMLQDVWEWAGKFRTTAKNIGKVDAWDISTELRKLLDDVNYWIDEETYFPDEIGVRFHQRLTWIHPFPNGNGRHGRLATDLLLVQLGGERFTWGSVSLVSTSQLRADYIAALRAADNHDYELLIKFVRS